jgi:hypothetical protein
MAPPNAGYAIVFVGRYPGKDRAVAQALGRAFGRDEAWGLPIVGATPVNLLTGLTAGQARALHAALAEVEQAGCKFQVQPGADASCPTVNWPGPPRIHGKLAHEYVSATSSSAAIQVAGGEHALACPHCGRPIQVRLLAPVSSSAALPAFPGAPIPVPLPRTPRPPSGAVPVAAGEEPPTPRHAAAPIPIPVPIPQAARPAPRPASVVPPPAADHEELTPIADFAPASATPAGPAPAVKFPAPRPAPAKLLPEVPIVDVEPPVPPQARLTPARTSDPRLNVPVDLATFEAGLQMGPAPEAPVGVPPPSGPPPQIMPPAAARRESGEVLRSADPNALCSIFIGKSANPKIHQLVAEIQGTSVEEAQRLCQKAVVPVVKDIPVSEAEQIRAKFVELNTQPRVMIKR